MNIIKWIDKMDRRCSTKILSVEQRLLSQLVVTIRLTVAGTPSSCLAPWLETRMAEHPASIAFTASSALKTPFATIGKFVTLKSTEQK